MGALRCVVAKNDDNVKAKGACRVGSISQASGCKNFAIPRKQAQRVTRKPLARRCQYASAQLCREHKSSARLKLPIGLLNRYWSGSCAPSFLLCCVTETPCLYYFLELLKVRSAYLQRIEKDLEGLSHPCHHASDVIEWSTG